MQGKDRNMLRKMRHCLGIRQVWLAKQTGIYRTKLSDFELGHLELTADELQRVKDAVGSVVRDRAKARTLPAPHGQLSQDSLMQGEVVKQLRCWYGITQAELGRKCGLSHDSISLFENGYFELDRSEQTRMDKALEDMISQKRAKLGLPPAAVIPPVKSRAGSQTVSPQQEREKTVEPSARQEAYNKLKCPVCGAAPSARVEATYDAAVRLWETVAAQQGIIAALDKIIGVQKDLVPSIPDWQSLCRDATAQVKEAEGKLATLQSKYDLEKKCFEIASVELGKTEEWLERALDATSRSWT